MVLGGLLAILAWLGLCLAVGGFIYLVTLLCGDDPRWPCRDDPMQNEEGDFPNLPDWWR